MTLVFTFVYIFAVLLLSVGYAHRMIGPMVPIRRQTEALKNGDYSARVTLRKRDAFSELADDLNELAQVLEEQEKTREPTAQAPGEA
jgi:signal transduction histidine kinase